MAEPGMVSMDRADVNRIEHDVPCSIAVDHVTTEHKNGRALVRPLGSLFVDRSMHGDPGRAEMASKVGSNVERNAGSGHHVEILLVDENKEDLAYYQLILRQAGCQVHASSSYDEALLCMTSERFDLVIVNQGGPDFEGKPTVQRAIEIDRGLPVLVLTRCFDMACYMEAVQLGAVDYLEEPVKASDLIYTLETHLGTLARAQLRSGGSTFTAAPNSQGAG